MSVLLFLFILFVLILVHELGHFLAAKYYDMRVDEFGIGFPPKLFGLKKGETEYTLNALPIGGFVKILGEDLAEATTVEEQQKSFAAKNRWAQAVVLVAGVAMNVLLAFFLFVVIYLVGVPSAVSEAEATSAARLVVTEVLADSPAATAELPAGATVTALQSDGSSLSELSPSAFANFASTHAGKPLQLTYQLGGEEMVVDLTTATNVIADDPTRPAIGTALSLVETKSWPLGQAIIKAGETTVNSLIAIVVGVSQLIASAFTLSADLSQVVGPVGIVGLVDEAANFGLISLLSFTAFISLNLAIINLLPIPALDGGRLVFVAIEAVVRRPINPVWMMRVNFAGFTFLILLMVAVTYNDILRIL